MPTDLLSQLPADLHLKIYSNLHRYPLERRSDLKILRSVNRRCCDIVTPILFEVIRIAALPENYRTLENKIPPFVYLFNACKEVLQHVKTIRLVPELEEDRMWWESFTLFDGKQQLAKICQKLEKLENLEIIDGTITVTHGILNLPDRRFLELTNAVHLSGTRIRRLRNNSFRSATLAQHSGAKHTFRHLVSLNIKVLDDDCLLSADLYALNDLAKLLASCQSSLEHLTLRFPEPWEIKYFHHCNLGVILREPLESDSDRFTRREPLVFARLIYFRIEYMNLDATDLENFVRAQPVLTKLETLRLRLLGKASWSSVAAAVPPSLHIWHMRFLEDDSEGVFNLVDKRLPSQAGRPWRLSDQRLYLSRGLRERTEVWKRSPRTQQSQ